MGKNGEKKNDSESPGQDHTNTLAYVTHSHGWEVEKAVQKTSSIFVM
jgi:hypothetical protein